jgi:signal-transduction protein with cAMP-binding, CBS, and nucleotidyltransferase domain
MHITEKLFALQRLTPFSGLRHGELALIAEVARERTLAPGEVVSAAGTPVVRLYAVVCGRLLAADSKPVPAVLGTVSLLYNYPLAYDLRVAPEASATCLIIGKGHFFTIVNECPEFSAGLIELARLEAPLYNRTS